MSPGLDPSIRPAPRLFTLVVLALAALSARAAELTIVEPPADLPVFDQIAVAVDWRARAPLDEADEADETAANETVTPDEIELWLDGRSVATVPVVGPPPWRTTVDVGSENRERRLEAIARRDGVEIARAERTTPAVRIDEQIDLGLQQLYVTVTDRRGRRVRALEQEAFTVSESGARQELVTFEAGGVPFTAALLVDASSSMIGERLEAARRGVERFVAGMGGLDLARLLVFSDRLLGAGAFSNDPATVSRPLAVGGAIGGTSLLDQLHLALLLLEERQGRRVVLILSDGWDFHSALDVESVGALVRRSNAQLFWLRPDDMVPRGRWLGPPRSDRPRRAVPFSAWHSVDETLERYGRLETMVRGSGGRTVEFEGDADLEPALIDILDELRAQYALGYYPSQRSGDAGWWPVEVDVESSRLRVRAPNGVVGHGTGTTP